MNYEINMNGRQKWIEPDNVSGLMLKHPHLRLFQKDDWEKYLCLIAQIYDYMEDQGHVHPYEGVKILVQQFYAQEDLSSLDHKVHQFLQLCTLELKVLREHHNNEGLRLLSLTREGRQLLQMCEELLSQRVKYSGTSAETLLGSLNEALISNEKMDEEAAKAHHKKKIKAYQEDLKRIDKNGVEAAKLLPIGHSFEALISQAESASQEILMSVEDVKSAIEEERKKLTEYYFKQSLSPGQSVRSIHSFYERLHQTSQYQSYDFAKNIFSELKLYGERFPSRDVDEILFKLVDKRLLDQKDLKKSPLRAFKSFFERADLEIQDKVREQIRILEMQIHYAIATDTHRAQKFLKQIMQTFHKEEEKALGYLSQSLLKAKRPINLSRRYGLYEMSPPEYAESQAVELQTMNQSQELELMKALALSEEGRIKSIGQGLLKHIKDKGVLYLKEHKIKNGLAEFYLLNEIENYIPELLQEAQEEVFDLEIETSLRPIVLYGVQNQKYSLKRKNLDG